MARVNTSSNNNLVPPCTLAINAASIVTSLIGLYYATNVQLPSFLQKAGHKQFLTIISLWVTIANNLFNVLNFCLQRLQSGNAILVYRFNYLSRHILLPLALLLETIVALVYWPLRLFAIDLIMQGPPQSNRSPIPIPVDISIHLLPIIYLLLDHYWSGYGAKFKISTTRATIYLAILGLAYKQYLAYLIDTKRDQLYPYPFLDVQDPWKSLVFLSVTTISTIFYCIFQRYPPAPTALPKRT